MNIEHVVKLHAEVIKEVNLGLIVDHSDVVGIEFSLDGKFCICLDCQAYLPVPGEL